jgi:hypothetical protein
MLFLTLLQSSKHKKKKKKKTNKQASKRENILDLSKHLDKSVTVKFAGGREGFFFLNCFIYFIFVLSIVHKKNKISFLISHSAWSFKRI